MMKRINAEWKKITYVQSSRYYLLFATVASILIGALFPLTIHVTQGRPLSTFEPREIISANMLGVDVVTLFLVFFTAVLIGREFQEQTIQSYLAAAPARGSYFLSKLGIFSLLALTVGLVVALATQVSGLFFVASVHKPLPPSAEVWRFTLACLLMPIFYTLLAVCASFLSRKTALGIMIPLGVLFLPALADLFPKALQASLVPALPAAALHMLAGSAEKGGLEYIGLVPALFVLTCWLSISGGLAVWRFHKEDL